MHTDTFVILYAGFIAAVCRVIGTEFGAHLIERVVTDFDRHCRDEAATGKQPLNLMSLAAELYIFRVIGSKLMFDYIKLFLGHLSEKNTELLLKIIRSELSCPTHSKLTP